MVLDTTIIAGYTVFEFLVVGGIVFGGAGVYWFLNNKGAQRKFNNLVEGIVQRAGVDKDKAYDEEKMREKVNDALSNSSVDMDEIEKEMTVKHVLQEIEAIESQARQLGREEERMKGEDSDSVYNLLVIVAAGQFGTLAILLWQFVL